MKQLLILGKTTLYKKVNAVVQHYGVSDVNTMKYLRIQTLNNNLSKNQIYPQ